jgi:hypothetical protein
MTGPGARAANPRRAGPSKVRAEPRGWQEEEDDDWEREEEAAAAAARRGGDAGREIWCEVWAAANLSGRWLVGDGEEGEATGSTCFSLFLFFFFFVTDEI